MMVPTCPAACNSIQSPHGREGTREEGTRQEKPRGAARGLARHLGVALAALAIVFSALLDAAPAYAYIAGGHWALAVQVEQSLPPESQVRQAMEAWPSMVAWGSQGPDLPAVGLDVALGHVPWWETYHNDLTGAYAEELMRKALEHGEEKEIAFAAGWITHMCGDVWNHGTMNIDQKDADPVVWNDIVGVQKMTIDGGRDSEWMPYLPKLYEPYVEGDPDNPLKFYNLFYVSGKPGPYLDISCDGVKTTMERDDPTGEIAKLVEEVNKSVVLDTEGPLTFHSAYPFDRDKFAEATRVYAYILGAPNVSGVQVDQLVGNALALLREKELGDYRDLRSARENLEKDEAYDSRRLLTAMRKSTQLAVDLLEGAEKADYSGFSDDLLMNETPDDGRGIGCIKVVVETGTDEWADTDAPVYFGISSTGHMQHEWELDLGKSEIPFYEYSDFERGSRDVYYVTTRGTPLATMRASGIKSVWLRLGDELWGASWELRQMKVYIDNQLVYETANADHRMEPNTTRSTADGGLAPWTPIAEGTAGLWPANNVREAQSYLWNGAISESSGIDQVFHWNVQTTGGGWGGRHSVSIEGVYPLVLRNPALEPELLTQASSEVYIESGQRYLLAGVASWDAPVDEDAVIAAVDYLDSAGRWTSAGFTAMPYPAASAPGLRVRFELPLPPPPADVVKARVVFRLLGGPASTAALSRARAAYLHHVQLIPEVAPNLSFEEWSLAGPLDEMVPAGWSTGALAEWNGAQFRWENGDGAARISRSCSARSGRTSVRLTGADLHTDFRVTPGVVYSASAFAQGAGQVQMMLRFFDASGQPLGSSVSDIETYLKEDDWSGLAASGAAPAGATHARLMFVQVVPQDGDRLDLDDVGITSSASGQVSGVVTYKTYIDVLGQQVPIYRPVTGARVTLAEERVTALTDGTGTYCIRNVMPGDHRLQFNHRAFAPYEESVTVAAGGASTRDVNLTFAPGAVTGTVVGPTGRPLPDVTVTWWPRSWATIPQVTGSDGRFVLAGLEPGVYAVVFEKQGYVSKTVSRVRVTVGGMTQLDPSLGATPTTGALRGWVLSEAGPVSGVVVALAPERTPEWGIWQRATTDARGQYRFSDVAPGRYALRVSGTGFGGASGAAVISAGQATTVSMRMDLLRYELSYASDGHGSVSGEASQTVVHGSSGAAVEAKPAFGYRFAGWSDGVTANPRVDTVVTTNIAVSAVFVPSDALLKSLKASPGTLSPKFSKTRPNYKVTLKASSAYSKITVAPAVAGSKVQIKLGTAKWASKTSIKVSVPKGRSRVVYVRVTTHDGRNANTYLLTVSRRSR